MLGLSPGEKETRGYGSDTEMLDEEWGTLTSNPHCHLQNPGHRAELKHDPRASRKDYWLSRIC